MRWLVVIVVAVPVLLVIAGALTGRVRARSCCAVTDPRRDLRMRWAFEDSDTGAVSGQGRAYGGPR